MIVANLFPFNIITAIATAARRSLAFDNLCHGFFFFQNIANLSLCKTNERLVSASVGKSKRERSRRWLRNLIGK